MWIKYIAYYVHMSGACDVVSIWIEFHMLSVKLDPYICFEVYVIIFASQPSSWNGYHWKNMRSRTIGRIDNGRLSTPPPPPPQSTNGTTHMKWRPMLWSRASAATAA